MTLNPSIDYIVHVKDLKMGDVNRMSQDFKLPGGKESMFPVSYKELIRLLLR
jgi:hypothetical protein